MTGYIIYKVGTRDLRNINSNKVPTSASNLEAKTLVLFLYMCFILLLCLDEIGKILLITYLLFHCSQEKIEDK